MKNDDIDHSGANAKRHRTRSPAAGKMHLPQFCNLDYIAKVATVDIPDADITSSTRVD